MIFTKDLTNLPTIILFNKRCKKNLKGESTQQIHIRFMNYLLERTPKPFFPLHSDATKSLSRKMKTNFASAVTNLVPVKSPTSEDIPVGLMPASEDLAAGQRQAAQDTQLLKSIVEPLEEQIGALKQVLT